MNNHMSPIVVCHPGLCHDAVPYVACDLTVLTPAVPLPEGAELQHAWSAYRRLDLSYYAYLYARMRLAKEASERQVISLTAYRHLREAFTPLHAWVRARYGDMALRDALNREYDHAYAAPSVGSRTLPALVLEDAIIPVGDIVAPTIEPLPFGYPIDETYRFTHAVTWGAVLLVDMIRDQARGLGWDDAHLYQNRSKLAFPYGQEYGLVCFLGPDVAIGEVTSGSIALVSTHPGGGTLRFHHPHADQPWRTRRPDASPKGG